MLLPKRVKYRRDHRGNMRGNAKGGTEVTFGEFGLQATDASWITNRQIESARIAMTRYMKRGGKVWIKIFPLETGLNDWKNTLRFEVSGALLTILENQRERIIFSPSASVRSPFRLPAIHIAFLISGGRLAATGKTLV
jgi:hypothetical protein